MHRFLLSVLLASLAYAQQQPAPAAGVIRPVVATAPVPAASAEAPPATVTIPAGMHVPLELIHAISTKTARPGDGVYLKSTFPVTMEDKIVIPAGTYVQGVISSVQRGGHLHGRAEISFHFTTLVFPNGYTVSMPAAVENVPGLYDAAMKGKEGTVQADSQKGRTVGTVASTGATGALVGLAVDGGKGAGIGAGIGAAAGVLIAAFNRGNDVRIEPGAAVEMVLERPLVLLRDKLRGANEAAIPPAIAFSQSQSPVEQRARPRRRPVLLPPVVPQ